MGQAHAVPLTLHCRNCGQIIDGSGRVAFANVRSETSPLTAAFAQALEKPPPPAAAAAAPLCDFEVFDTIEAARGPWLELAAQAAMTPYQCPDFLGAWQDSVGAGLGVTPMIVLARDEFGRPSALFPFCRARSGPWRVGMFLGGRNANYNLALIRRDARIDPAALAGFLRRAGRSQSCRVDAFALKNQPLAWHGARNPLARPSDLASSSVGYRTQLRGGYDKWLGERHSGESRKKLRKKAGALAAMGALRHCVAMDAAQAAEIIGALRAHKLSQLRALGADGALRELPRAEFLALAAAKCDGADGARLEFHALKCGERIVATFAGLAFRGGLYGLFISYDQDKALARCSPGVLLVNAIVASLFDRGYSCLDLGAGGARYKEDACEVVEPLFDRAIAVSVSGRLWAVAFGAQQRLKRRVKRSPRAMAVAARLAALLRR